MRGTTAAKLEQLFALIVTVGVPAGVSGASACGGIAQGSGGPSGDDGGSSTSSGATSSSSGATAGSSSSTAGSSSGWSSSGFGSSGGTGSSSGSVSSSGSSSGVPGFCDPYPVTLDAGLPDAEAYAGQPPSIDGGLPRAECSLLCPNVVAPQVDWCTVADAGPPATIDCQFLCLGGRRPEALRQEIGEASTSAGAYFASLAQLEAASVPAFRRMARELARFGAPRRLVKAAERAAREEVRHARGAASLAKRHGAKPASFTADVRGGRSLEAFATENAVEGCVRETYGALVATWQAREASDPLVRAHMARIAKEETTHAALAWRADAWARGRLAKDARARVEAARAKAARDLIEDVTTAPDDALTTIAGVPTAPVARRLASDLVATLA